MTERKRDLSFEKLAEVCGVEISSLTPTSRGAMNRSLAEIRTATPDLDDAELATVIEHKARLYRKAMPEVFLTPTALAKHWPQLEGMIEQQQAPVAYVSHDRTICSTCDGLRFVLAYYRRPQPTAWMASVAERPKAKPIAAWLLDPSLYDEERHGHEVMTPCPDCNVVGQALVKDYLDRFNRNHAGGPRLPVPDEARTLVREIS